MNDDAFDRDLRTLLAAMAPAAVPAKLRVAVAGVPARTAPRSRQAWLGVTRRWAAAVAAIAILGLGALAIASLSHSIGPAGIGGQPTPSTDVTSFHVEYQALPVNGRTPTAADMAAIVRVASRRLELLGVTSPAVMLQPPDRIVIVGQVANEDVVRVVVGTTGHLDFVPLGQNRADQGQQLGSSILGKPCDATTQVNCVLFSGDQVASASIGANQSGLRTVSLVFKDTARALFAGYTAAHVGEVFAVALDGVVVTAPTIMEAIPDGGVDIGQNGIGGYPLEAAQNMVVIVNSGELPYPLRETANSSTQGSAAPGP